MPESGGSARCKKYLKTPALISKKLETTGLGLDESKKEIQAVSENWWHDGFTSSLQQFKIKNLKSSKTKKRNLEEDSSESKGPPTYDELFRDIVTDPKDRTALPNRMATQLRNTPQLTKFDDDAYLNLTDEHDKITKERINYIEIRNLANTTNNYYKRPR